MIQLYKMKVESFTIENVTWHNSVGSINPNALNVFNIDISDFIGTIPQLSHILTSEELEKSAKYFKTHDQHRSIISKAILKILVGKLINRLPSQISFFYDKNSKPYLLNSELHFNISHSGNKIVIAFHTKPIGIDVEKIDLEFNFNEILNTVFTPIEIQTILEAKNSFYEFYKFWTRKESFVKALSKGIDDDFIKIPSLDGVHYFESDSIPSYMNWSIQSIPIDGNYVISLSHVLDINNLTINFVKLPLEFIK